jgi:Vanadium chloroperoxidase N-terminal domain
MRKKLAVAVVLVAALVMSTFTAVSSPPSAQAQAAAWDLNAYGPRPATDNGILYWNETLLEIIRKHPPQTGPTVVARALGILHTATYDAWAAYDPVAKGTRLGSQLRRPAAERTTANKERAISFAAYRVLLDLFPAAQHPRMGEVDLPGRMRFRGHDPDDTSTDTTTPQGIGNVVAKTLLDYRHHDGSNQLGGYADYTGYTPRNDWNSVPQAWNWQPLCVPTPPANATTCSGSVQKPLTPQWGQVKPFALVSPSQFRVTGPPKNADGSYSTSDITQEIADAANLDDVKKAKAEYWADGPKTEFPPGHMGVFAQALCRKKFPNPDTDAKKNQALDFDTKLFFALGNALMDASIAAWAFKYKYDFVRPITAIRDRYNSTRIPTPPLVNSWRGPDSDPNFEDVPGEQWMPYQALNVVTPPFPEYPSGHSTFSAAGSQILIAFSGSDTFGASVTIPAGSLKIDSNTPSQNVTLSWPTFTAAADQAGWSRRYGGIHFKAGDQDARLLGKSIGQSVWSKAGAYINGTTSG